MATRLKTPQAIEAFLTMVRKTTNGEVQEVAQQAEILLTHVQRARVAERLTNIACSIMNALADANLRDSDDDIRTY